MGTGPVRRAAHRTLSEEDLDAAAQLLKDRQFTRTAVAKRLGVSRATLWRGQSERQEAGG